MPRDICELAHISSAHLNEEVGEPLQGVLVHGVHDIEISHAEVHDGPSIRHRSISLTSLIDLLLCHLSFGHLHTRVPRQQIIFRRYTRSEYILRFVVNGENICSFQESNTQ